MLEPINIKPQAISSINTEINPRRANLRVRNSSSLFAIIFFTWQYINSAVPTAKMYGAYLKPAIFAIAPPRVSNPASVKINFMFIFF